MKRHSQRGRPPKASERRTDTITFRVRASLGDQLRKTAAKSERSLSDEIEHRLEQTFSLEAIKADTDKMHAEAKATLTEAKATLAEAEATAKATLTEAEATAKATLAEAKAALDATRVQTVRLAALYILREIEGRPNRVIIDLETLLAEADGIARGLRPGFVEGTPPTLEATRPMTTEEAQRLMEEIEKIKRRLDEAVARPRAADAEAASKSDDEAA